MFLLLLFIKEVALFGGTTENLNILLSKFRKMCQKRKLEIKVEKLRWTGTTLSESEWRRA